jgi:hypothetical protein
MAGDLHVVEQLRQFPHVAKLAYSDPESPRRAHGLSRRPVEGKAGRTGVGRWIRSFWRNWFRASRRRASTFAAKARLRACSSTPDTDVKAVRERIGLSQAQFAKMIRVSVKTLQN